jgi:GR25 family glycosyltransferase involved in LPS biosynthesis
MASLLSLKHFAILLLCSVQILCVRSIEISAVFIIGSDDLQTRMRVSDTISRLKKSVRIPNMHHFPAVMYPPLDKASLFNRVLIHANIRFSNKQILNSAQLGTYLSHLAVWGKLSEQKLANETWLIMEDDYFPLDNMYSRLQKICGQSCDKFHLINLLPWRQPDKAVWDNELGTCNRVDSNMCWGIGAAAYLLTRDGARMLCENALPAELAVDWYMTVMHEHVNSVFQDAFITRDIQLFELYSPYNNGNSRSSLLDHTCFKCDYYFEYLSYEMAILCIFIVLIIGCISGGGLVEVCVRHQSLGFTRYFLKNV